MASQDFDPIRIDPESLTRFARAIFEGAGSSRREAELVSDNLVLSNLYGHDSHGIAQLPRYVAWARDGRIRMNQAARIAAETGPLLVLDGNFGYGQVIGAEAMRMGVERALEFGVCVVSLRRTHHLGRIGHWAEQCAAAGLASVHFVNAINRPGLVAPFGGRDARFQTNPFCAALPRKDQPPVVLDFATSKIAMGKVRVAFNRGEAISGAALLDSAGNPTEDPSVMLRTPLGALVPFGEHKGYGLAVICELFGGALTGGGTIPGTMDKDVVTNNMLSIILDPDKQGCAGDYAAEVERFIDWVRASPPAPGFDRVRIPGEPERETAARRAVEGIPIDTRTWGEILTAASSVGVSPESIRAPQRGG
jgi:hydroxycarboxylate dehydrogenase B